MTWNLVNIIKQISDVPTVEILKYLTSSEMITIENAVYNYVLTWLHYFVYWFVKNICWKHYGNEMQKEMTHKITY